MREDQLTGRESGQCDYSQSIYKKNSGIWLSIVGCWRCGAGLLPSRMHVCTEKASLLSSRGMRLECNPWSWLNVGVNIDFALLNALKERIEEYKSDNSPEVVRGLCSAFPRTVIPSIDSSISTSLQRK